MDNKTIAGHIIAAMENGMSLETIQAQLALSNTELMKLASEFPRISDLERFGVLLDFNEVSENAKAGRVSASFYKIKMETHWKPIHPQIDDNATGSAEERALEEMDQILKARLKPSLVK